METLSPTAPINKPQPAAKSYEVNFASDSYLKPFWSVLQSALEDAVKRGDLNPLEFGVYQGSQKQVEAFHADLDKRLSTFSKTLL